MSCEPRKGLVEDLIETVDGGLFSVATQGSQPKSWDHVEQRGGESTTRIPPSPCNSFFLYVTS
jgi:hypothetical protein